MNYIDFHAHAFADKIAEKAMSQLAATADIVPCTDGTVRDALRLAIELQIDGIVLMPIATKPSQQKTINNWAKDVMIKADVVRMTDDFAQPDSPIPPTGVLSFGTIHPDADDRLEELERIKELGLYGVKMHCDYQLFFPDDEKMFPVYKKAAKLGLPMLFHGGFDPVSPDLIRGTPQRFASAIEAVPEMTFIIAHLGGMYMWDDVEKYLAGKFGNVFFDISVIADEINDEQLFRIIRTHGADKILFGSDLPWDNPKNEISMIERIPLTEDEKELIFYKNAKKLLNSAAKCETTNNQSLLTNY